MFYHRSGYKPQAENVSSHARRRYRLVASTQMGMASPDPNLWLVHYSKATPENRHPSSQLPLLPQVAQIFQARQIIQRSGQLPRKEFLLHDRSQWPVISLPAGVSRSGSGQAGSAHRRGASLDQQAIIEEEEDVSRGDLLDFVTPREISRMRYEQHHEWMEEIMESPYATRQIIPSELGLGRKGTLESFTDGFFTAPISPAQDPVNGQIGKLAPGRAAEFTKHADAKLAEMQADLERMKQQHIKRMEKLRRTTDLGAAERKLRNMNAADEGYKNVAAQVQDMTGRKIESVHRVHQVSKGGQQDIKPIVHQPQHHMQQNQSIAQPQQQSQQQLNQVQAQMPQQQQQPQLKTLAEQQQGSNAQQAPSQTSVQQNSTQNQPSLPATVQQALPQQESTIKSPQLPDQPAQQQTLVQPSENQTSEQPLQPTPDVSTRSGCTTEACRITSR